MATKIGKPVTREIHLRLNGAREPEPFIVTLGPEGITYRRKGKRDGLTCSHEAAYLTAGRLAATEARRARQHTVTRGEFRVLDQ